MNNNINDNNNPGNDNLNIDSTIPNDNKEKAKEIQNELGTSVLKNIGVDEKIAKVASKHGDGLFSANNTPLNRATKNKGQDFIAKGLDTKDKFSNSSKQKNASNNSKLGSNNFGKKNLNGNNSIAQPSVSHLGKEKEKNSTKLKEQLQKNAIRAAANAFLPGVGGKLADAAMKLKEKNDKKKKDTSEKNDNKSSNPLEGNNTLKTKGAFSINLPKKKLITILAPACFLIFIFMILAAVVTSNNSEYNDLIGVGSSGVEADVNAASGGNEKLRNLYNSVLDIREEYSNNNKVFSADLVISVYHILNRYDSSFGPEDMTDDVIREVVDYMFVESCNGDSCTYTYSKETFKSNLALAFFPEYLSDEKSVDAANEVFEYIAQYQELIGYEEHPTSNGGSCSFSDTGIQAADLRSLSNYDQCIQILGPIANAAYSNTGVFASVTLAQAIIESGCGKHTPASSNNLFGIKCSSSKFSLSTWDGSCTTPTATHEVYNGNTTTISATFKKYKSVDEAILDHAALLAEGKTYKNHGVAQSNDPLDQANRIKSAGYATDPDYASKIKNVINKYNLAVWDTNSYTSCTLTSGDYSNWKQYDDKWGGISLGKSSNTIKSAGCLVTSLSMLIAKSGVSTNITGDFNPGSFVEKLNELGAFSSGGALNWGTVTQAVPSFKYVSSLSLDGWSQEDKLTTISNLYSQGFYIVVNVKKSPGQHWVAVNGISGSNVNMMDPASKSTDMWSQYNWADTTRLVYYTVG